MKRPWLTESLAAKRQCLDTTLAAIKDAITLCHNKIAQYEEQNKAHDAEIQETFEAQFQPQTTTSYFSKIHGTGCTHTVDQSEVPSRNVKRPCPHCTGRTSVLPEAERPIIATTEIHISDHDGHYAGHEDDIIQLWMDILKTKKLRFGFIVSSAVLEQWMCFPLCNMRHMCPTPSSHFHNTTTSIVDYHGRVIHPEDDGTFIVYHMVPLVHLVSRHQKAPGSSGILKDAGMRNGSYHGDGVGIYAYASPPYELFKPGDGWCMVKAKCRPFLTRVKSGSRGRYVLKSDQSSDSVGSLCIDCEVTAVLHMYSTLPDFLTF